MLRASKRPKAAQAGNARPGGALAAVPAAIRAAAAVREVTFSDAGASDLQRLTREIAQRGARVRGRSPADADADQHFAT